MPEDMNVTNTPEVDLGGAEPTPIQDTEHSALPNEQDNEPITDDPIGQVLFDVEDELDEFGNPLEQEDEEPSDNEGEGEGEQDPEPQQKRVQTPEENAYYAELRRQQQLEQRIQEELQKRLQQTPEYQIAQFLSQQYGMPPEELYQRMQEAALQKQAEEQGVPIEVLKQLKEYEQRQQELEQKLIQFEFNNWYNEKMMEAQAVKEKYNGIITDEDINQAIIYMLDELGTTKLPLDKAVRLVHGDKIEEHLLKMSKQEALAEVSGRKPSPLAPQNVNTPPVTQLTPEEKYIAKQMGISEEDYLKYKNMQ